MIQEARACGVRDSGRPCSVGCHAFHGAVQIISRSSSTHGLERRLVRFLRLPRATLGLSSCLIPDGCRPDPAGFSAPYSSVLCLPFERHWCRPSALDTSTTALTALKSTSLLHHGSQPCDLRSFGPLSCTNVISFPGPHSELPVSSFTPLHRDRHSRPAPPERLSMPRLIAHHTSRRQSRTLRGGLNRPACARPVAGAAAM